MSNGNGWMPLYIGDYLGDTMELDAAQHGAYLLLLMYYWRNGPLPRDDAKLAQIARTELRVWKKTVGPVVKVFFHEVDGRLHQKRADIEMAKAAECHQRAAERRSTDNDRLKAWRAKQGQDGRHPPEKANGKDPPPETSETRFTGVSPPVSERVSKRAGNADETRTTSTITGTATRKEEREFKNKNSLPSNGLIGSRARGKMPPETPPDNLVALFAEAEIEQPKPGNADPELVKAHVRRVAKACEMRVPYGAVRGRADQITAAESQQLPVVEDVGYRWAPAEPVRTVEQQLAELERMMRAEAAQSIAAE